MDDKLKRLYRLIKTEEQKKEAIFLLEDLSQNIFMTDGSLSKFIKRGEKNPIAEAIVSLLPDGWRDKADKSEAEKLIGEVKKNIQDLKTVGLTLAIEPNKDFLNKLENWAADNFGGTVVFDITVDPNILGGAIITENGKYMDYSLSKRLNEVLSNKREELISSVSNQTEKPVQL